MRKIAKTIGIQPTIKLIKKNDRAVYTHFLDDKQIELIKIYMEENYKEYIERSVRNYNAYQSTT